MWLSKNRCYRLDLASQPASEEAAGPQPPLSVRTTSPVRIQQEEVPKGGDSLEMWEISLSQQPPAPSEHGDTQDSPYTAAPRATTAAPRLLGLQNTSVLLNFSHPEVRKAPLPEGGTRHTAAFLMAARGPNLIAPKQFDAF